MKIRTYDTNRLFFIPLWCNDWCEEYGRCIVDYEAMTDPSMPSMRWLFLGTTRARRWFLQLHCGECTTLIMLL